MRVGLVCPYDWGTPGGVQAHVRDLAQELIRLGHQVSVLAPCDDSLVTPDYVVSAGRSIPVPYNGSVARLSFGPGATARVRRWIREGEFDVLHVHEPASPSLSVLACWAALGPIVGTFHMSGRSRAMTAFYSWLQTALEKVSARIAVSEYARTTLVEHLGGDAVLIPNGVATEVFAEANPFPWRQVPPGSQESSPTVGFLGRIDEPRKGLAVLLSAWPQILAEFPEARLLVAGPGERTTIDAQLPPSAQGSVEYLGLVSEADKARLLRSLDVYVAPNTGGESFGIILLEAMAAGATVAASDLAAFLRVLDGGSAGAVFPVEDSVALAATVAGLLGDPHRRELLRARASVVVEQYDWRTIAQQIVAVYETVTVAGQPVREDTRGQLFGRFTRLREDE